MIGRIDKTRIGVPVKLNVMSGYERERGELQEDLRVEPEPVILHGAWTRRRTGLGGGHHHPASRGSAESGVGVSGARRIVAVTVTMTVLVGMAAVAMAASTTGRGTTRLAARLAARDPGARVGGNTFVATTVGQRVYGAPRRPNFIIALGSRETIVGSAAGDQLGATGAAVRIESRGGHSLIVDRGSGGRILVRGSGNTVVVTGRHDRVVCARGSRRNAISIVPSDTVGKACRTKDNAMPSARRRLDAPTRASAPVAAHTATVTGSGTNADPYAERCTQTVRLGDRDVTANPCTIAFPARTLSGLWANEYVPSYKCPGDLPFLLAKNVNQAFGTTVPDGVEIEGLGPIGISITKTLPASVDTPTIVASGFAGQTATGYPDSSATNWSFGSNSYRVVLHCALLGPGFWYPAGAVHPSRRSDQ